MEVETPMLVSNAGAAARPLRPILTPWMRILSFDISLELYLKRPDCRRTGEGL